jgi:hypothetical protein
LGRGWGWFRFRLRLVAIFNRDGDEISAAPRTDETLDSRRVHLLNVAGRAVLAAIIRSDEAIRATHSARTALEIVFDRIREKIERTH